VFVVFGVGLVVDVWLVCVFGYDYVDGWVEFVCDVEDWVVVGELGFLDVVFGFG